MVAISCDDIESHCTWIEDIKNFSHLGEINQFPFPIIDDKDYTIASKFNMIDFNATTETGKLVTCRAVFRKLSVAVTFDDSF